MATVTTRPPGLRGYDARWTDATGTALVGPDGATIPVAGAIPLTIINTGAFVVDGSSGPSSPGAGSYQTAIGYQAGVNLTTGYQTAIGDAAGYSNTSGNQTAIGHAAGYSNTTGDQTAIGHAAGYYNTTGQQTAIGHVAGYFNTTGNQTAVGYSAGYSNTTGIQTAIGHRAGYYSTGSRITVVGAEAGKDLTTGNNVTIVGEHPGAAGLADALILATGTTARIRYDTTDGYQFDSMAPAVSASTASTHKIPIKIGGVTYNLLATNV